MDDDLDHREEMRVAAEKAEMREDELRAEVARLTAHLEQVMAHDIDRLFAEVERLRAELAHHHCESCDGSAPECWADKRAKETTGR